MREVKLQSDDDNNKLLMKRHIIYSDLTDFILKIQRNYDSLQSQVSSIENTLIKYNKALKSLQKHTETLVSEYHKSSEIYNAISNARLDVIKEQAAALAAYRRYNIKDRIKAYFAPKLGVLYQYESRPLSLPKHYFKRPTLDKTPTISIVTPSYNQGAFIERTIKSVLSQGYPNLEYVVQDGNSKDDTKTIIEKYSNSLRHWESVPDKGQSHAINLGFAHTTGEIMAYLNSDDLLLPGSLQYVADYFVKNPDVDVVYGHRILVDQADGDVGKWVMPPHDDEVLSWADYIPQETLFWRRSIWEKVGGKIDEDFRFAMDWDLILRFRDAGAKFKRLPRFLGAFRIHPQQKTSSEINEQGQKEMEQLRLRCHGRNPLPLEISANLKSYFIKHIILTKLYNMGLIKY